MVVKRLIGGSKWSTPGICKRGMGKEKGIAVHMEEGRMGCSEGRVGGRRVGGI